MSSNTTYQFSIQGPSCANQCTNNNVTNSCQANNSCLCKDPRWSTNYACCVQQACNETDFETSVQNWKNICLMEVVPPVTASIASCLPTATPTNGVNSGLPNPALAAASQTSHASSSDSNASSMPSLEKWEIGLGVGVGVPVAVALVLMVVICVRVCKRRRRSAKHAAYNLDRVYGTSAENLRDLDYFNNGRTVPTTVYASPRSPPLDHALPALPSPLSPPAMEVPLVYSQGTQRLVQPASPLRTPPAFEAFHPSKRMIAAANFSRPETLISEQLYPTTLRRPESSSSSVYSEKGPYEMAP